MSSPIRSFCRCIAAALPMRTWPVAAEAREVRQACSSGRSRSPPMPYSGCSGPASATSRRKRDELLALVEVRRAAAAPRRRTPRRAASSSGSPTCARVPIASGMLVVAAAMIAPVSWYACSLRHSAERSTCAGANDRQRAGLRPQPPAGDGRVEIVLHRRRGRRLAVRAPYESTKHSGSRSANSRLPSDVRHRHVRVQVQRAVRRRRPRCPIARLAQLGAARARSRAADRSRSQMRGCPRSGRTGARARSARRTLEPFRDARREVDDLPRAVAVVEHACAATFVLRHVRHAGPRSRGRRTRMRNVPPLLVVEQPREHRRRIEARQAQPLDRARRRDQREHAAVADRAVVEVARAFRAVAHGAIGPAGGRNPRLSLVQTGIASMVQHESCLAKGFGSTICRHSGRPEMVVKKLNEAEIAERLPKLVKWTRRRRAAAPRVPVQGLHARVRVHELGGACSPRSAITIPTGRTRTARS